MEQEELPPEQVGDEGGAVTVIVWVGTGRQPPRAARESEGIAAARRESAMARKKVRMALEYMMFGGDGTAVAEAVVVAQAGGLELKNSPPRRSILYEGPDS